MTSTNDKVRALFLTALMVGSVFALTVSFSGAAAAEDVSINSSVEYDGNIEIVLNQSNHQAFSLGGNSSLGNNVSVYLTNASGTFNVTSEYGSVHSVRDGTGANATVLITGGPDVSPLDTLKVDLGNVTDGNHTVGTIAGATVGTNVATTSPIYHGSNLVFNASSMSTQFDLINNDTGDRIRTRATGQNSSTFVIDTGSLTAGTEYRINTTAPSGQNIFFTPEELGVTASVDSTSITTEETLTITAEADDINREVQIKLVDSDDNDHNVSRATLDSNGQAEVEVNNLPADTYTAVVTDADSGITAESSDVTVSEAADLDASFSESVFSDNRGDVIELTINDMKEGSTVNVQLGTNSSGYNVTFSATDGGAASDAAEDGNVTVLFNTSDTIDDADNSATEAITAKGGDDSVDNVNVPNVAGLTNPIAVGAYDLSVFDPNDGTEFDVAQVNVQERATSDATSWVAPDAKDVSSRSGVLDHATTASEVSTHDKLVVSIGVSGLEGTGVSTLDATNNGLVLNITEQNPGQNADAIELTGNSSSVTLVDDTANDTIYAVIDVSAAGFEKADEVDVTFEIFGDGFTDGFRANNAGSPLLGSEESETVSTSFTVVEDKASFSDDPIVVRSESDQTISGTTTRAPGTNLTVTVRSPGNFLQSDNKVTVADDGTWSVDYDFSGESTGTEFTASISAFDVSVDGTISGAATVSMADQTTKGSTVVVESVTMPAGGFVAIHEGSASGPVIGSSEYLNSSTHTNVKITLDEPYEDAQTVTLVAMPHKDTDGDKVYDFPDNDGPYTDNGSAVVNSASVTVEVSTPTPRVVTVQQPSPTPRVVEETRIVEETRVVEQTRVVEETVVVTVTQGQPGFGIAVAVVALLAAALLAVRRRD